MHHALTCSLRRRAGGKNIKISQIPTSQFSVRIRRRGRGVLRREDGRAHRPLRPRLPRLQGGRASGRPRQPAEREQARVDPSGEGYQRCYESGIFWILIRQPPSSIGSGSRAGSTLEPAPVPGASSTSKLRNWNHVIQVK